MRNQGAVWRALSAALVAGFAFCGAAHADDTTNSTAPTGSDGNWAARAQAGYSKTGGTTDTTSFNGLFHVAHTLEQWKFLFGIEGNYGATGGQTTAQAWDGYLQANYNISDRLYWFGKLSDTTDKFSGFAFQQVISTGVGYQFIRTNDTKLSAQVGIGERRLRELLDLTFNDVGAIESYTEGSTEHDTVADGQVNFEHSFNQITKIVAAYEINTGKLNTMQSGSVSLVLKMSDLLGLSVSYSLITNSNPPPGVGRSASLESVNLVYTLKNKNLAPE